MSPHSEASTNRYYDERAEEYAARTERLDMEALYKPFLDLIPSGGAILDAGCGPGRDAQAFAKRGYRVTAFDASSRMVELTRQRTGINAVQMRFQDLSDEQEFDGIWACASLLHLPDIELDEVLGKLRRALKVGGVCYMSFKWGTGERLEDGRRFIDFTEMTLAKRIEKIQGVWIIQLWTSEDQAGRSNVHWVNAIIQRIS
jgi:SAM-dependent methyltransferase